LFSHSEVTKLNNEALATSTALNFASQRKVSHRESHILQNSELDESTPRISRYKYKSKPKDIFFHESQSTATRSPTKDHTASSRAEADRATVVEGRHSYTNETRAEIIRYWETPSIFDVRTGKFRKPTLAEVKQETGVPKSNMQRWAQAPERDKIFNGRPTNKKNRVRKEEMAPEKDLSVHLVSQMPEPEVVSTFLLLFCFVFPHSVYGRFATVKT
jgi:hypothetical protein